MLSVTEIIQSLDIGEISQEQALDLLEKVKTGRAVPSKASQAASSREHNGLDTSIKRYLNGKLQTILAVEANEISADENLMALGVDSVQLIALTQEIEAEVDIELYPTLFFEYQTIDTVSTFLAEAFPAEFALFLHVEVEQVEQPILAPADEEAGPTSTLEPGVKERQTPALSAHVRQQEQDTSNDIAVIGMAGVFPQSPDVATFWQHLYQKTDLITEIPADHFDYRPWYDPDFQVEDKLYCKWGSFIEDVDKFDAGFFNISPREAELMDPQLRYLLQVLVHTAEDAGYGGSIRGSQTGVYVGTCFHDYTDEMIRRGKTVQGHDATGTAATMLANRPSFYFDLTGPSLAIDTACSSSLFALHYACQALQNGECDMAFAAGVNLLLSSRHYRYFCNLGALSPTGRCHTFDERADGYVPGEAIAAVLLKPLSQAVEAGDQIYGIIKGSAVGHGGYTPSITAPSVDGEVKVLLAAWQAAGINPETLGYIEAHGTGTKLGDPIEIAALNKAFRTHTAKEGFCGIGSAKAHLGHTEGAAGIVGVIKTLLAIRHGIIPAMPQFERLNPYIQLEQSPFYINPEPVEWAGQANWPRRAGVSSFGFGGAYAHVVVEEAPPVKDEGGRMKDDDSSFHPSAFIPHPYLFVLSARNEERLRAYVQKLLAFLENTSSQSTLSLASIAYTLQVGREAMEARLALVVSSVEELIERLRQYDREQTTIEGLYRGHTKTSNLRSESLIEGEAGAAFIKIVIDNRELNKLAQLWVAGIEIDWRLLYGPDKPCRISLPTYPFERERYWIPTIRDEGGRPVLSNVEGMKDEENASSLIPHPSSFQLHPLVHRNISDLAEQRFSTTFSGTEFFLTDHQVQDERVLPGVVYLEMARIAGELAVRDETVTQIKDVVWIRPVVVKDEAVETQLRLYPGERGEIAFEISSRGLVHSQGKLVVGEVSRPEPLDIRALEARCGSKIEGPDCYRRFREQGLLYGPAFQGVAQIRYNQREALARLRLPAGADQAGYGLHPSVLDAALQATLGLVISQNGRGNDRLYLPFAVQRVTIYEALAEQGYAYVQYSAGVKPGGEVINYDITVTDEQGAICVALKGFTMRARSEQADISQLPVSSEDLRKIRIDLNEVERNEAVVGDQTVDATAVQKDHLFQATENYLKVLLSTTLKLPAARIESKISWEKYGIDSIMVLSLIGQLEQHFGELRKTLFFEYQSLTELTDYFVATYPVQLQKMLGLGVRQADPVTIASLSRPIDLVPSSVRQRWLQQSTTATGRQTVVSKETEDIAIVGLSGRYPLAESLTEFWQNLKAGRDCITEIPAERWDWRRYDEANKPKPGQSPSKWGGFMADVDKFDPLFFNISPREAELMDPQERLFLEIAWQTLEDAGYTRQTLAEQVQGRVGVFVGVMWGEYQLYGQEQLSLSSSYASIANRVSYCLNLHGPSLAVDTMCSSSLTSIHLACESLKRGECAAALAGGVNVSIHPNKYLQLSQRNFTASDGRCRSFGEGGDGYVPGEGVGAVLLKPLSQAEADGDAIYGVIKGSYINHGGKTPGYTVPNPNAQGELIATVLAESGVGADTISYVEAHGTGTALGDPIEIRGLSQVWSAGLPDGYTCAIGSVKSNIGHLESAAGIAGLTKVLLQMKHRQLVPSLHSETLNPYIDFEATPFRVQRELSEWKQLVVEVEGVRREYPRRAGISSFGAGGAYAHLVVEEYEGAGAQERRGAGEILADPVSSAPQLLSAPAQLIVLSARNEERLRVYAQTLLAFLENASAPAKPDVSTPTIEPTVRAMVAEMIGVEPDDIEVGQAFEGYDLDPVQLSRLKTMVEERYDCELPVTLFSGQTSVGGVAKYLASQAGEGERKDQVTPQPALSLASIAYTLQVGREAMETRLALVVSSVEELIERLHQYDREQKTIEGLYLSTPKINTLSSELLIEGEAGAAFIQIVIDNRELNKLAQLWVAGIEIDWRLLYGLDKPCRISLPTYPFERKRYWIPTIRDEGGRPVLSNVEGMKDEENASSLIPHPSSFQLYPLVHRNISDLAEQRFSTTFSGTEFFLTDHQVQGEKVLPGVAYLEMARIAGELAVRDETVSQIKDVVWLRPLVVKNEPPEVQLGLYLEESGEIAFEVSSNGLVHNQGKLVVGEVSRPEALDIAAIESHCGSRIEGVDCYRRFRGQGLLYGPAFQGVAQIRYNQREALARLRLPAGADQAGYGLHPSVLDAALQATLGLAISQNRQGRDRVYLPFAVQTVNIYETLPEVAYAYVQYSAGVKPGGEVINYDITVTDEQGAICVALKGFTMRAIPEPAANNVLYGTPGWQVKPLAEGDRATSEVPTASTLLLIGLEQGTVETITATFNQVAVVELDPANVTALIHQSWQQLKAIIDKKPKTTHHILVVAADTIERHLVAPLAGLLKTARLEQPHIRGKTIAVSNLETNHLMSLLGREMRANTFADVEIRYDEAGTRSVKILREIEATHRTRPAYLKPGGVYWITGGLGGLGRIFTRHLLDQDETITIILSGRSDLDEAGQQLLADLNHKGGTVAYLPVDVSVQAEVERVVQTIRAEYGPLNGIIHSAGVIRDSLIINKTEAEIEAVLAPKVSGFLNIDAATQTEALDFVVLFSSLVGVLGNLGQADYAAANAFLDGFAHHRQALVEAGQRSGRTLSINWPLWAEGGMSLDPDTEKWVANRTGLKPLSTEQGLKAFDHVLAQNEYDQLLVAPGDRAKIRQSLGLVPVNRPNHRPGPVNSQVAGEVKEQVENALIELCVALLKVDQADLDIDTNFAEYGVDSILMMGMLNELEELYGIAVAPMAIAEHPTIRALADYLIGEGITGPQGTAPQPRTKANDLNGSGSKSAAKLSTLTARRKNRFRSVTDQNGSGKVAIIGQACRLPQSPTPERFWDNLAAGRDLVTSIPADRWQAEAFYSVQSNQAGKTYSNHGAFIDGIGYFDAGYFGIADEEAITMDPQQRIILELAQELWDQAGYRAEEVAGTKTSIFIGAKDNNYVRNYYHLIPQAAVQHTIVNTISNMIAARVSDFYNLTGTAQVLDTACSSSLVAVHDACRSLLSGESELAIAGGIFLMVDGYAHIGFSQARVLSADGTSYVFDERANGFVLGEGGGLVLLKEYGAALRDGDQILGVILGSAVNNDGHTMGLTVPNQAGQKAVIEAALRRSHLSPADIGYLEAHGTGTLLGDPIEIRAATEVYRQYTSEQQYCAVGSVKSNLGHTMTAAGITSLIKMVLSLEYRQIPATLHCEKPHPRFKFEDSPFYPNTRLRAWEPRNGRRIGAISSFGFGGTNCHLIVEEGHQAQPIRQPLPRTQFRRKRYWLGQEIVPDNAAGYGRVYYEKLLDQFLAGELDEQDVEALIRV